MKRVQEFLHRSINLLVMLYQSYITHIYREMDSIENCAKSFLPLLQTKVAFSGPPSFYQRILDLGFWQLQPTRLQRSTETVILSFGRNTDQNLNLAETWLKLLMKQKIPIDILLYYIPYFLTYKQFSRTSNTRVQARVDFPFLMHKQHPRISNSKL